MKHLIAAVLLVLLGSSLGVRAALPEELTGEWRQPGRGGYSGIYIRPDGSAGFIAASDDGQKTRGDEGVASYEPRGKILTLTFAESRQKTFRYAYDAKRVTLTTYPEPKGRTFHRHSATIPDWVERLRK